jgi:hypothetical protein
VDIEGVTDRQVPDQLVAVARDEGDLTQERPLSPRRVETEYARFARSRIQQASKQLERRRFPGAVGSKKADHFPR